MQTSRPVMPTLSTLVTSKDYFERLRQVLNVITSEPSNHPSLVDMCTKLGMKFDSFCAKDASNITWDDAGRLLTKMGLATPYASYMQDSKVVSIKDTTFIAHMAFDTTLEHANFAVPARYAVVGKKSDGSPITMYSDAHLVMLVNSFFNEWMLQKGADPSNPSVNDKRVKASWFKQLYEQRGKGPSSMAETTSVIIYPKFFVMIGDEDQVELNVNTYTYGTALRYESVCVDGDLYSSILKDKDRETKLQVGFVDYDRDKPACMAFRFEKNQTTFEDAVKDMQHNVGAKRKNEDNMLDSIICPLTQLMMRDPVIDPEGNSYERVAIEEWLLKNETSPITRSPLKKEMLTPNRALKETIDGLDHAMEEGMPQKNSLPFLIQCKTQISCVGITSVPVVCENSSKAVTKGMSGEATRGGSRGSRRGSAEEPPVLPVPELKLYTTTANVSEHVLGLVEPLKTRISEHDSLRLRPACVMTLHVMLTANPRGNIDAITEDFAANLMENLLKTMLLLQEDMQNIPDGTKFASISKQPEAQFKAGSEEEHLEKNILAIPNPSSGTSTEDIAALLADAVEPMQDVVDNKAEFTQALCDVLSIKAFYRENMYDEVKKPLELDPGYTQTKNNLNYLVHDEAYLIDVTVKNIGIETVELTPMYFGDDQADDYSESVTLKDGEEFDLDTLSAEPTGVRSGWKLKDRDGNVFFTLTLV